MVFRLWGFFQSLKGLLFRYLAGTMVVLYSDHHLFNRPVFRPTFEYWFTIQIPVTMVPGIWIVNHLNNEQLSSCYTDVSAIQMFTIQITTVKENLHRSKYKWMEPIFTWHVVHCGWTRSSTCYCQRCARATARVVNIAFGMATFSTWKCQK